MEKVIDFVLTTTLNCHIVESNFLESYALQGALRILNTKNDMANRIMEEIIEGHRYKNIQES